MGLSLIVANGPGAGIELRLEGRDVLTIGSAADANVRIDGAGVAPQHARIFVESGRLVLMDATGDGVLVNGKREAQAELRPGDEVVVGRSVIRVRDGAASPGATLVVLRGPEQGRTVPIGAGAKVSFGRSTAADVTLTDMKTSREHCRFEERDGGWLLTDLASTNGTKLNDVRLEARASVGLRHGDRVKLGDTILEFRVAGLPVKERPLTPSGSIPRPFEIDIDEPAPIAPLDRPRAVTQRVAKSDIYQKVAGKLVPSRRGPPSGGAAVPSLEGELEKIGFAQLIQFLSISQRSGELIVRTGRGDAHVHIRSGNVTDAASPGGGTPEQSFFEIARFRRGHFEFHEKPVQGEPRIKQPTPALLMEAMRRVDETTGAD